MSWLVKGLLIPLLTEIIISLFQRYREDLEFRKLADDALDAHMGASTKEERANARKAIQAVIRNR